MENKEETYNQWYTNHYRQVEKAVMDHIHDPSLWRDLTQDVWEKVWQRMESFDPSRAKLSTWIGTIARNTCLTYLRDNVERQPELVYDSEITSYEDVEVDETWLENNVVEYDTPQRFAEADELHDYYERLSNHQRAIIDRMVAGQSYKEIAESLGLSQSAVRKHVERVKAALGY